MSAFTVSVLSASVVSVLVVSVLEDSVLADSVFAVSFSVVPPLHAVNDNAVPSAKSVISTYFAFMIINSFK